MILQNAFKPATIKIGLESEDKDELLEELIDLLSRNYPQEKAFPREKCLKLSGLAKEDVPGIYKGLRFPTRLSR